MEATQAIAILDEIILARRRAMRVIGQRRRMPPEEQALALAQHENAVRALEFAIRTIRESRPTELSRAAVRRMIDNGSNTHRFPR